MAANSSSVENGDIIPPNINAGPVAVWTSSNCSLLEFDLVALGQDGYTDCVSTSTDEFSAASSVASPEMSSVSLDALSLEPLSTWCGRDYEKECPDLLLPGDLSQNYFDWWNYSGNLLEPWIEKMPRPSSVTFSESSSSEREYVKRRSSLRQSGVRLPDTGSISYMCAVCLEPFTRIVDMEKHAKETKHKPFACTECTTSFSRQDALTRHRDLHDSRKLFACPRCLASFRRRDHLRQHLSKKHRVHPNTEFPRYCSYDCCTFSTRGRGDWFNGFSSRREYSKHMREVHGKETHGCEFDGCDRVGNKGFARINDLHRHRKHVHGKSS